MDLGILRFLNQFAGQSKWLDQLGSFIAVYAIGLLAFLVILLWFLDESVQRKKNQYAIVLAVESVILAFGGFTLLIRSLWPRLAPFVTNNIKLLIEQNPLTPSFPSGHTVIAFALALPVLIYNRKAGIWLFVLAILIGASRVFVGAHYPSDILGGFAVALIVVLFLNFFRKWLVAPVVRWLRNE